MDMFYFVRPREKSPMAKYRPVCKFFKRSEAEKYIQFIGSKFPGYGRMDIIAAEERPEEWHGPQPMR